MGARRANFATAATPHCTIGDGQCPIFCGQERSVDFTHGQFHNPGSKQLSNHDFAAELAAERQRRADGQS